MTKPLKRQAETPCDPMIGNQRAWPANTPPAFVLAAPAARTTPRGGGPRACLPPPAVRPSGFFGFEARP